MKLNCQHSEHVMNHVLLQYDDRHRLEVLERQLKNRLQDYNQNYYRQENS